MGTESTRPAAALALPASPVAKIEELRANLERLATQANLVTPIASLDYIPQMHRVSFRVVVIDATLRSVKRGDKTYEVGTDTYRDPKFCEPNERALTKTGVLKIFRAAGIDVVESRRVDDRSDGLMVAWRVVIDVPELDGRLTRYVGTKELDFRPGSPSIARMSEAARVQAASVILENAETKAMLRAARAALQLRQKYTLEELAKPFVIPMLVPDLDASDPEIKRMIAAKALRLENVLYGHDSKPDRVITIDAETVPEDVDPVTGEDLSGAAAANAAAAGAGDDLSDLDTPPANPDPACSCPCGCMVPVSRERAAVTLERRHRVRCAECYPGKLFNEDRHKSLADLDMEPRCTVKQALEIKATAIKAAAK